MSSKAKNYLLVLLAATTATSSVIAWKQNARLSDLQAKLTQAAADAAKVKPRSAPVASEFIASRSAPETPAEVEPAAPGEEPAAQQRQRGNNNNRPNFAALMANPEFAQAMNLQQRAALENRYADLFKKLNLSPEQLEKFKTLLLEKQNARMDVMTAARESGLNPRESRDELRKLTAEAEAEVDANIKSALGESVYNQYANYDSTQSQRNLVKQLDQRLSYSATALNSTQTDFLVSALSASGNATTSDPAGGGGGPGNWGGGGNRATITDAVIQQAQSVLTADQVTTLKQLQAEQQAQQKIREMTRPTNGNNANGGGARGNRAQ